VAGWGYHAVLTVAPVVHTTGINWDSVGVISGIITVVMGGLAKYILNAFSKARAEERATTLEQVKLITDGSLAQVKLMTEAMGSRMDQVDSHLTSQDVTVAQQGRDLSRIEGRMMQRDQQERKL
jgi:hypothetical protein